MATGRRRGGSWKLRKREFDRILDDAPDFEVLQQQIADLAASGLNQAQVQALITANNLGAVRGLWFLANANFNSTADQPFAKGFAFNEFRIDHIVFSGADANITTAAGGIYTGAGKTGTQIVLPGQVYTALSGTGKILKLTSFGTTDLRRSDAALYLSLSTPQGSTCTVDIAVYGVAASLAS